MLVVLALVYSKERSADLNRRGQEVRAAARALAENQAKHGPAAPPRCIGRAQFFAGGSEFYRGEDDSGPCVRTLSSDFALAQGNFSASSWPARLNAQNELFCARAGSTHEVMENKLLAQGLLQRLGIVARSANLYGGWKAKEQAGAGWPQFDAAALQAALDGPGGAQHAWVLKSASDQASYNVLAMTPHRWACESWNTSAVAQAAATMLAQPTMKVRCPGTAGHERRGVILQRLYPWRKKRGKASGWDEDGGSCAEQEGHKKFLFEVKATVVWGKLGTVRCELMYAPAAASHVEITFYFDESGVLTIDPPRGDGSLNCERQCAPVSRLPPGTILHVASVVRAAAAELQTIARKVSRLFKADLWRLDVFLSESEPPHVNELTYPSFRPDDPRDLARLADGYRLVARRGSSAVHGRLPISLVPAACAEIQLNAVLPGSVREPVNSEFDPRVCEGSSVY